MPKGKRRVRRRIMKGHVACPNCGNELYIEARVSKTKRRGIRRAPNVP